MLDGLIFVDKEENMSSRKVDNYLGHLFNTRKIGHLGTLDPFATGLLIIGINKGTKALPYLSDQDKTYLATLKLGEKTSTLDYTGEILAKEIPPKLKEEEIINVLNSFLGVSYQIPPMVSAIKIDGKRLYKIAREGKEIERKERKIEVFSISLVDYRDNKITFLTKVSKGTYIRVLGEDIAKKLGTIGHLESLRRLSVGPYQIKDAKKLKAIKEEDIKKVANFIPLKHLTIDEKELKNVKDGKVLKLNAKEEQVLLVFKEEAIAVYKRREDGYYEAERGLF